MLDSFQTADAGQVGPAAVEQNGVTHLLAVLVEHRWQFALHVPAAQGASWPVEHPAHLRLQHRIREGYQLIRDRAYPAKNGPGFRPEHAAAGAAVGCYPVKPVI